MSLAAAGAFAVVGAGSAVSAQAECVWPAGAKLIRSNGEAQVTVEQRDSGDPLGGGSQSRVWRGCSTRHGEQVVLDSGESDFDTGHGASRFRLSGSIVGFLTSDFSKYESATRVVIADLATGARWTSATIGTLNGSGENFTDLAVNRAGDGAWIRTTVDRRGRARWLLFVRRGSAVQLRYSAPRRLSHLRLSTSHVRWRENAARRVRGI